MGIMCLALTDRNNLNIYASMWNICLQGTKLKKERPVNRIPVVQLRNEVGLI